LINFRLSKFQDKKKNLHLFLPTKDISSIDPRLCYIPFKLAYIHAFHFNILEVKKFLAQQRYFIYKGFLKEKN
jgi:hypothetical protein